MPATALFYRLILRPLLREPLRTLLTTVAVALGVAVVLAISLAGNAAAGSFHSSMESLAGDSNLEVIAAGGVPEEVVGTLAALPYPLRVQPRLEGLATAVGTQRTVPLIGLDLVAEAGAGGSDASELASGDSVDFAKLDGVWLSSDFGARRGERISLRINDHTRDYPVLGVLQSSASADAGSVVVMDMAEAQRELGRRGRVDRIHLKVPDDPPLEQWRQRLQTALPEGVEIRPSGSQTDENRRMLGAFRLNLRVLSYIALLVGAFLIYNTISVSVVRRRAEIGIVRALGATRASVLAAFLGEAAALGVAGGVAGCLLGRLMAVGALQLVAATVQSLYVTSRPAPLELSLSSWMLALVTGAGVAVAAALAPAREASRVSPVEAMARGARELAARSNLWRDLCLALAFGACGTGFALAPQVGGLPLFGYAAALLLVAAAAFAMPALVHGLTSATSGILGKVLGVEAMLAARSLNGSLRRTAVLVGALTTAVAMMASVGIMVGSFRETVRLWMENQLQADFYLRPAGAVAPGQYPTLADDLAQQIEQVPGVAFVDRFRAYEISYQGMPATLAGADMRSAGGYRRLTFLSGRSAAQVYARIVNTDAAIISEPFAHKHHLRAGDSVTLPMGAAQDSFRIEDVYYDYSTEAGFILLDRGTLLKYLPDPAPSNVAVYLAPGAEPQAVRAAIERAVGGRSVLITDNRFLREQAIRVFDRTFLVTYALEVVSVLVAVIGIAGALLALVVDRRREFGLLRFLGASTAQVRKWILVEAGLIGLLASVAGFLLGVALSLILIYVVNKQSFGWTIQFHWPVAVLTSSLLVIYLATLAAGLYPARIAARLNPIEVIHEE
jgi:putative ABC transport system permease protein